jgi:hypothetical protein
MIREKTLRIKERTREKEKMPRVKRVWKKPQRS